MVIVIFLNLILLIRIIKNVIKKLKNPLVIKTNHVQKLFYSYVFMSRTRNDESPFF
jgi:hypothetical protein